MAKKRIKLTDQLRQAIDASSKSRYRIAAETGIGQATLSRFMHKKGGLSMEGLDKLGDCLGLTIVVSAPEASPISRKAGRTKKGR